MLETAKRREEFDPEAVEWVTMADGQEWGLAKPWLIFRPVLRGGKVAATAKYLTQGPELDALIEAIAQSDNGMARINAIQVLAAHLLMRHYDLTDEELGELVGIRPGDPASLAMIAAVIETATGATGKKPSPAGAA